MRAFSGAAQLLDALSGCDVVVIPAGVPRKPGMTVRSPGLRDAPVRRSPAAARLQQRDDLFNINAGIVKDVCKARLYSGAVQGRRLTLTRRRVQAISSACPRAIVNIISNPVNSTVPIAAEVLKQAGVYDARRLFGSHSSARLLRAATNHAWALLRCYTPRRHAGARLCG